MADHARAVLESALEVAEERLNWFIEEIAAHEASLVNARHNFDVAKAAVTSLNNALGHLDASAV